MSAEPSDCVRAFDVLLTNVRDLLDSPNARDRVRAVHHVVEGAQAIERRVLLDAHAGGMTWAEIGALYGVPRQAAHRRSADETIVPADYFERLIADLHAEPEVVPSLARAAERARRTKPKSR